MDSHFMELCEVLSQILLFIPYYEENMIHKLLGITKDSTTYTVDYTVAFSWPSKPTIYGTSIRDNDTSPLTKGGDPQGPSRSNYKNFEAAECKAGKFILMSGQICVGTGSQEGKNILHFCHCRENSRPPPRNIRGTPCPWCPFPKKQKYINKFEDAQAKVERTNKLVTNATLVIITTEAILSTEKFLPANKDWEELDSSQRTWIRWKTTYHVAAKKVRIKNKAAGVKDQFGAANSATPPLIAPSPLWGDIEGNNKPMGLEALDGYFGTLVVAATNEKSVLEESVTNLTTLTTSNADMAATIKNLTGENRQLQK